MGELERVLARGVLLELAGERYFERGEGYHRGGHVRDLVEHEGVLAAKVLGTHEYRVKLRAGGDELRYSCTCPLGVDGAFCKHCVAVGLTWLEGRTGGDLPEGAAMESVRAYLEGEDREVLVRLLVEQAMEDERLRGRLLMRAARSGPEGLDLEALRRAVDAAFDAEGSPDYYPEPEGARAAEIVVESIAELLEEGHAAETIELSEYALAAAQNAMDHDVYGHIHGALRDLEELHHAACEEAKPDPEALARRLFEWELRSHYDTFSDAVNTYADVLGEKGLAEYRRLAEERWACLPELGPGADRRERYGGRYRLTRIMETLARQGGGPEALVAVKSKDLSDARAYLEIAQTYKKAGDRDKALGWAERGMRAFPERPDPELRDFLAKEYHNRRRHGEAMDLIWAAFAEAPHLANYQKLKGHAIWAGAWSRWREMALELLREDIARKKKEPGTTRYRWSSTPDHSRLVEVYLWEDKTEAAWREAQEGGCSEGLWLRLAAEREEEHPEDAVPIYRRRAERLIEQTNKGAYEEACEYLVKVRELMGRLGRQPEFAAYLEEIRKKHRRKRNLMKLLDEIE